MSDTQDSRAIIAEILQPWTGFVHSEYDGTNLLDEELSVVDNAKQQFVALLDREKAKAVREAIEETWNYTGEGYNGEYDGLTHIGGKRYTNEEVMEKVIREVMERLASLTKGKADLGGLETP